MKKRPKIVNRAARKIFVPSLPPPSPKIIVQAPPAYTARGLQSTNNCLALLQELGRHVSDPLQHILSTAEQEGRQDYCQQVNVIADTINKLQIKYSNVKSI